MIDLRSDTVTRPTAAMREAMTSAKVGDDVFGEDPTVNELEARVATLLGQEASLFVPSGTMGNLISILVHCPERGKEVFLGDQSHIFFYEQAGASALGSLAFHTLPTNADGTISLDGFRASVRDANNPHYPAPGVLCLENTHNRCGGAVLTPEYCKEARKAADGAGVPLHLDGARLANAAVALNVPLADLARPFHSVQFDLSKGLGAPVGGMVAGSKAFIEKARRTRKLLGGGMRQAGILAAAGIVAVEKMIDRLAEDHAAAKRIAAALSNLEKVSVPTPQTNLVLINLKAPLMAKPAIAELKARGLLVGSPAPDRIRVVTHYDVSAGDIDKAISILREVLG